MTPENYEPGVEFDSVLISSLLANNNRAMMLNGGMKAIKK